MERNDVSRRRFIGAGSVVAVGTLAGCGGVTGGSGPESASFTFDYAPEKQRLTLTHDGGGAVPAGALSIRTSTGSSVAWSELGSTTESREEEVTAGSQAVLGPTIINWERPVTRTELIRVVFTQEDGSVTTLGRFESELTATAEPTATATPTPERGVLFSDDFEDGTLAEYDVITYPAKRSGGSFRITRSPSRGDYAVRLDTTNKQLKPTGEPTLEPPLTVSIDFYVNGWSGVDIALQYDSEQNSEYAVKLRNNNNGPFIETVKRRQSYEPVDTINLKRGPKATDAFAPGRWERATVSWETDGTIAATVESTGTTSRITDTELSGYPFFFVGYHYSGWAAFDNVHIERSP